MTKRVGVVSTLAVVAAIAAVGAVPLAGQTAAAKPAAKAQQYVASGVPVAVNSDSYSAEYFLTRGFEVASPDDTDRWLSREYWEETHAAGERLRAATSLEAVAARYRELIESL